MVIIIIGILAAIAIPTFLNQKKKAGDTSAKADVTTIGKNIAAYYVDGTEAITVAAGTAALTYQIKAGTAAAVVDNGTLSKGNTIEANSKGANDQSWCVAVKNATSANTWAYSSTGGLVQGTCPA